MNQSPADHLFAGLRDALEDLAPDRVDDRIRSVLDGFLKQFQLVPKHEYESHLAVLTRLEETVADLEARISELEQDR